MKNLQEQVKIDAAMLQTLFRAGKYNVEILTRYNYNLELLYILDKDFLNAEPTLN